MSAESTERPAPRFDLDEAMLVLARTPGTLRAMLAGLPPAWTTPDEGPGTWSPFDVVGHLVNGEETDWMVRVRQVLAQGEERRFRPFDRTRNLEANRSLPIEALLDRFADLRAANLAELRAFRAGPAELARTGEHPDFGPVTLAQLLATWVVHDLDHLSQVARVMAKRYTEAVGPWIAFLRILRA